MQIKLVVDVPALGLEAGATLEAEAGTVETGQVLYEVEHNGVVRLLPAEQVEEAG